LSILSSEQNNPTADGEARLLKKRLRDPCIFRDLFVANIGWCGRFFILIRIVLAGETTMYRNHRCGAYVFAVVLVGWSAPSPADADIFNFQTGETIPGTEGIVPGPRIDLSDWNRDDHNLRFADLQEMDLLNARFTSSWLDHARFRSSDLRATAFLDASLTSADFSQAELDGSVFDGATLTDASLANADLTNASFETATMDRVDMRGAMIGGANLRGTTLQGMTKEQFYSTASYQSGDIQRVILDFNDLRGWALSGLNAQNASFQETDLRGASFRQTNLEHTSFLRAFVAGADLTDAIVVNADFSGSQVTISSGKLTAEQLYTTASYQAKDLHGIQLRKRDLSGWNLAGQDLTGASFASSILTGVDLSDAVIARATFNETVSKGLSEEMFYATASYKAQELKGIGMDNNRLVGWNFAGQDLANASFRESSLRDANLAGANLEKVDFFKSNLKRANLSGANLRSVAFNAGNLTATNLRGANLENARFLFSFSSPTTIEGADFTDAIIRGVDFGQMTSSGLTADQIYATASYKAKDLRGVQLDSNQMDGWDFSGQDLDLAAFEGSTLVGATFRQANLSNTLAMDTTLTDADFRQAIVRNVGLERADLTRADFSGADLSNTRLFQATLADASFDNAVVSGTQLWDVTARGFTKGQFYSTASYRQGNIARVRLMDDDLTGWEFAGQSIRGGSFSGSTLTGADFRQADLSHATFVGAALTDADLTGAVVTGAFFSRTVEHGFRKEQFYATASYQAKRIGGIHLDENDLTGWNFADQDAENASFQGSTLDGADFQRAQLAGGRLKGAILTGADLREADLTTADFQAATLAGADFRGAVITEAILAETTALGFTREQLYTTANYQANALQRIGLWGNDLTGWNFRSQNLADADFEAANLTDTDLSFADLRGALVLDTVGLDVGNRDNTIMPDGQIDGLEMGLDTRLVVRDDEIGVTVEGSMVLAASATLELRIEDTDWGSTISLAAGVVPDLAGTLELGVQPFADLTGLVGTTFRLFDWNGQLPEGERFDRIKTDPGLAWDTSRLYATGEVTLLAVPEPTGLLLASVAGSLIGIGMARRGESGSGIVVGV